MALLKNLKLVIGLSKEGLTKLNADLRRTKSSFKRNFGEIAGMAKNAALAIGTTLVASIGVLIKKGAEMETLRTGFISIAGGANKAAAIVKELNEFTAKTPFQLQEVSNSARQLLAVGTQRSELQKELKMLGDIAASSGNSISDISAIFAKVRAKGKVDLEALNQLAERRIPIFDQLRKVTGDANMEFGAGAVSVKEFNTALANMTAEGGLAAGAMENLSDTVEGRITTLMDNLGMELGKAAEKTGLMAGFGTLLKDATESLQGISGAAKSDVAAALGLAEEAMEGFGNVSQDNLEDVEIKSAQAQAALKKLHDEIKEGAKLNIQIAGFFGGTRAASEAAKDQAAMLKPLVDIMDELAKASVNLNETVMAGDVAAGGDAGGDKLTLDEFKKQFEAAAKLTEARQLLNDAINKNIVSEQDEAEALKAVNDRMREVHITMREVEIEEEQLFDEESNQRVANMERVLERVKIAAKSVGAAFSFTSQLTEAAFANIKDKSQGFHEVVKNMLESLLKKAIALAAAFAAITLFTGGGAAAAKQIGTFKNFMLGGFGVHGFAAGGMVTGPTMAMVGEGPGTTLSNPEVIAPLDKLQQMMGGGAVTVTGMIRGSDILLSNERSALDRNRVRGF